MIHVDPKVAAVAADFVDDVIARVWQRPDVTALVVNRQLLVERAAAAMQRAIEDECDAIRRDLGIPA